MSGKSPLGGGRPLLGYPAVGLFEGEVAQSAWGTSVFLVWKKQLVPPSKVRLGGAPHQCC